MTNLNLSSLSKGSERTAGRPSRGKDWRSRIATLIPFGLIIGFVIILYFILGERLIPARELTLDSVVTLRAGAEAQAQESGVESTGDPYEASALFQASGWVEPDPLPIKATALLDGVVDTVNVLEGERVAKGQLLATLIDDDARLDLETAQSHLRSFEARLSAHHGILKIAQAKIETFKKRLVAAEAKRAELADRSQRYEALKTGVVPEREVVEARLQLATQEAENDALAVSGDELRASLQQHKEMEKEIRAAIAVADTEVARRELALKRTRITSPVDGIVLRLLAVPGQKRMLGMDDPNSATIAILYQPDKLQVRIDVPLEEAAQLAVNQKVRIRSNFLPDQTFRGSVTRIVGEADLQRNTLQAKVRIENPDIRLRPEMLCRAEFLASGLGSGVGGARAGRVKVFVSESALIDPSSEEAEVWVLNSSGDRVNKKSITLGSEKREEYRLVKEGLNPGDRVVIDPPSDLKPDQRVKPGAIK